MYHMTLLCIAGHFLWYGFNNETYFSIFQANTSGVARNEDWGWPALGGPGSVLSEDIQWVEMSEPSLQPAQLYSDRVSAYDGDDLPLYV